MMAERRCGKGKEADVRKDSGAVSAGFTTSFHSMSKKSANEIYASLNSRPNMRETGKGRRSLKQQDIDRIEAFGKSEFNRGLVFVICALSLWSVETEDEELKRVYLDLIQAITKLGEES